MNTPQNRKRGAELSVGRRSSAAGWREPPHGKEQSRDSQLCGDGAGLDGRACHAACAVATLERQRLGLLRIA